jgi:ribosomal protein S27AE
MKNGICPKCGESSVFTRTAGISRGDGGVHVYTGGVTKPTKLEDYACTRCGFIESTISDYDKLKAIEQSWSKIG